MAEKGWLRKSLEDSRGRVEAMPEWKLRLEEARERSMSNPQRQFLVRKDTGRQEGETKR